MEKNLNARDQIEIHQLFNIDHDCSICDLKKVSLKKSKISWQNLLGSFATKYLDLLKLASMLDSKFPDSILDFDIILYQYYQ